MNTTAAPPILDRLSALGDETRTRILALLERSEFTVSELCDTLQTAQPTVSRHLKTLTAEGWLEARTEGRNRHYRLSPSLDEAARALWRIVREEIAHAGVYAADAERARSVLEHRRLRSAEFFAESAERWDEVRSELFGSAAAVAPLFGLIDARCRIGDLGTGTGGLAARLAPFADSVIAVDRSEEMLAAAEVRVRELENVELRRGELEDLPIDDDELDVAFVTLVLHYLVDPPAALAEARRVLRPGGRIVMVDMRRHDRGHGFTEAMGHVWPGFEPERIEAWLADAGFADARVVPLPYEPGATGPLLFLASGRS